jgi:hypothetical protein
MVRVPSFAGSSATSVAAALETRPPERVVGCSPGTWHPVGSACGRHFRAARAQLGHPIRAIPSPRPSSPWRRFPRIGARAVCTIPRFLPHTGRRPDTVDPLPRTYPAAPAPVTAPALAFLSAPTDGHPPPSSLPSGDPASIHCGDYLAAKGVGWTRVATPSGPLDIFNTHLHANYSHKYAGTAAAAAATAASGDAQYDIPAAAVDEFAAFRMAQVGRRDGRGRENDAVRARGKAGNAFSWLKFALAPTASHPTSARRSVGAAWAPCTAVYDSVCLEPTESGEGASKNRGG